MNAARRSVLGMDVQMRLLFLCEELRQIGEAGVQEVARRRREDGQWIFFRQIGIAQRRFARRNVGGQRIETLLQKRLAVELALARRRGEIALGKRRIAVRDREPLPALLLQRLPVDPLHARVLREPCLAGNVLVGILEAVLGETHARCQQAEHFAIGLGFADRCDGRVVGQRVEVPVGLVHVVVFELRGGGEHDVGVVSGVGLELFEHDGEQVLARKAFDNLARIRRHRHRIGVVDAQRADGRIGVQQCVADGGHVDGARVVPDEVRPLQGVHVDAVGAGRGEQRAARRIAPRADEGRQAGHCTHRHAAAGVALHAVVEADDGGFGSAVLACEADDAYLIETGDAGDFRRGIVLYPRHQAIEAERVFFDVVVVKQIFVDEHVHQPQGQRRIGSRQQRQMLVAFLRRLAAVGIDGNYFRAAPLGVLDARPQVQVGDDGVGAPDEDQPGIDELFHVRAHRRTNGRLVAGGAGGGTDGAVEQ